jgi:hypothetical protein
MKVLAQDPNPCSHHVISPPPPQFSEHPTTTLVHTHAGTLTMSPRQVCCASWPPGVCTSTPPPYPPPPSTHLHTTAPTVHITQITTTPSHPAPVFCTCRHTDNEPKAGLLRIVAPGGRASEPTVAGPGGIGSVGVGTRTLSEGGAMGDWSREEVSVLGFEAEGSSHVQTPADSGVAVRCCFMGHLTITKRHERHKCRHASGMNATRWPFKLALPCLSLLCSRLRRSASPT